jgi:cell division transport system ATP-binding protein
MKLLLAEEYPTDGTIFFESNNIHTLSKKDILSLRRKFGTVFQDFRLINTKTVYENVAFAMEVTGHDDDDIREYVPHVLELVNLTHKANSFPHTLSGGEKQRLAIARAIIHEPEVVLADEPTASLDPVAAHDVMNVLKKICDLGATVLVTTHNPELARTYAKRIITLEKGRIIKDDKHHKTNLHV